MKYLIRTSIFIVICLFFWACKKEYLPAPYTQIASFVVTDSAGNQLQASITGDSIRMYWPPFQSIPDSISPVIEVSKGATVLPASGKKVALKKGMTYTITAQDGSVRTMILVLMPNEPLPIFTVQNAPNFMQMGGLLILNGQYLPLDTNRMQVYLVNKTAQVYPISFRAPFHLMTVSWADTLPQDLSIDTGYYTVRVVSAGKYIEQGPYFFGKPDLGMLAKKYLFQQQGQTIKAGTQISFTYQRTPIELKFYAGTFTTIDLTVVPNGSSIGTVYSVPVDSQTSSELKYTLPANLPAGTITRMRIFLKLTSTGTNAAAYTWTPPAGTTTTITL